MLMRCLTLTLFLAAQPAAVHAADAISITGAVSRATPAGASTAIGFMTITNNTATEDRLVAASSPAVDHIEIHEMAVTNGVMTMRQIPGGLPVPAHSSVALKSGSYHLMLIKPKAPFKTGDTVPVMLTFEHAGTAQVDLKVEPIGGSPKRKGGSP
jgi:periplasmic copper chaperone A